jgi:diguanylate cyclase (GGDEF)-like protein/PAS domain S-box-containing protein
VDITERKIAQERLLQHDQRLSAIIDNFPGGISMIDADLHLVVFNKFFKQMLDLPDSLFETSYPTLEDIFRFNALRGEYGPGDIEEQIATRIERARKFQPHKFERVRPNGSVLEVLGEFVPGGGFITIYLDITERKRQDDAINDLANRLMRFRTAMDVTKDALYLVDRKSMRFIDFNASACSMLGLSREEVFEVGPTGVLGSSLEDLARIYDEVIAKGVAEPIEALRTRHDGARAWVEILRHAQRTNAGWIIVTVARDITERKKMEEQVHQLAFYDPLTTLANRRLLTDRLAQSIAASKRSGCYGALIFLDLDNFKSLNDTHGHAIGDLLLVEAARRLTVCVREIDTVARLGGDEFVVVLSDLDASKNESTAKAAIVAEKIRNSLAEPYILAVKLDDKLDKSIEHYCTASIGVIVFNDSEGTQDDFMRWADTAMYQAKEAGSNLIRFCDSVNIPTKAGGFEL